MADEQATFRHWQIKRESDRVVWLSLNRTDSEVNTLSREVLRELSRLLEDIPKQQPAGLVLCSGKLNGFVAGADVTEFSALADSSEALKFVEFVHGILDRLEQFPFPTICLVHGFCLGGGLELALACRTRIATDAPTTKFGLPEVRLGIHPGFGGTVRLPRLIGILPALDLMLSGRSIDARQARKLGLVDYTVPERQIKSAVQAAIQHPVARKKRRSLGTLSRLRVVRCLLAWYLRRSIARRVAKKFYPAPYAILDLWERYGGDPTTMYHEEARSVASLVTAAAARNLVRVFLLQERMKALSRNSDTYFHTVHVIGAGTMGADIASWCALQGLKVTIQDVDHQRLATAVKRASILVRKNLKEPRLVRDAMDRFIPDMHGDGIARADVVIEAIFEDAAVKQKLYQEIEPGMRKDALLATNTSSIPLEVLAESLMNPRRFVGLHFFNPVAKMLLVEVVRGKSVGADELDRAIRFVAAIGHLPLPVTSSPGFLINRLLTPYLLEAVIMEQEGIPAADIDRAACEFGMPMGPLLLADTVGLDICLSVARILAVHYRTEIPKRLEDLIGMGRLGKKSGRGFYAYEKGKTIVAKKQKRTSTGDDIGDRLMLRLLNEAIACWREKIVADGDLLDAGAIFGIGFAPFRGGPLHHICTEGAEILHKRLRTLEERYGDRFAADPGWGELQRPEVAQ